MNSFKDEAALAKGYDFLTASTRRARCVWPRWPRF